MKSYLRKGLAWLLLLCICLTCSGPATIKADNYSKYSTKKTGWGLGLNKNHTTPSGSYPYSGFKLKNYNALYVGNTKEKVMYFTFDCGYENGNTAAILDTLKKNDIKAIFFVTKYFVESQPKLVKRMKKEGHLVGNHTCSHPSLPTKSTESIKNEITGVEKAMKEKTGYTLDKFVRPPMGEYNEKVLKILQDMGYTTVFWSLAWFDYDEKNQPSVSYVVDKFKTYHHKGMIPLIHNTSSADTKALPQIISYMKSQKYHFERLDEFTKKAAKITIKTSSYSYNGKTPKIKVTTNSDGKLTYTYYNSKHKKIKKPIHADVYYIRASVKATDTYKNAIKEKKFRIKKATSTVKVQMPTSIKEGDDLQIKVSTNNKKGKLTYFYYDNEDKKITQPTTAGSYSVQVKVSSTEDYTSVTSKKLSFIIHSVVEENPIDEENSLDENKESV